MTPQERTLVQELVRATGVLDRPYVCFGPGDAYYVDVDRDTPRGPGSWVVLTLGETNELIVSGKDLDRDQVVLSLSNPGLVERLRETLTSFLGLDEETTRARRRSS